MKNGWCSIDPGEDQYYSPTSKDVAHYVNGVIHNDEGPALVTLKGSKHWFKHGRRHRERLPAVEFFNGVIQWWYEGELIRCSSNEEFLALTKFKAFC